MNENLLVERYKYILDQKKRLNETTFKIAAFYQGALLVILGGQFRILELNQKKEVSSELAEVGSWGLFWAVVALSFVSLLLLVGGIASWFDYRREEADLEGKLGGLTRLPPSWRGVLRWYETYIGLLMIVIAVVYWCTLNWIVLPAIVTGH